MKLFSNQPWLASAIVLALITSPMWAPWLIDKENGGVYEFLRAWQALIAGSFAIFAAWITVQQMQRTLAVQEQERKEAIEIRRRDAVIELQTMVYPLWRSAQKGLNRLEGGRSRRAGPDEAHHLMLETGQVAQDFINDFIQAKVFALATDGRVNILPAFEPAGTIARLVREANDRVVQRMQIALEGGEPISSQPSIVVNLGEFIDVFEDFEARLNALNKDLIDAVNR